MLLLWSLQDVELLFSFCANAKVNDIAGIVDHHYHVLFCKQKWLNHLSITHDP